MTLTSPITAVCERSIPAVISTNVWPIAITSSGQAFESSDSRLLDVAMSGTNGISTTK